jgi:SAM-dependent methyltransferase
MSKIFNFIKQVFQGKSIYRILFNWQVEKYCQNLTGTCLDLAAGKEPSYYRYWSLAKEARLIRTDYNQDKNPDLVVDLNGAIPLENNSVDNVFFFNAIYIIKEPEKLLKEIYRILKKDGQLFIASPFIFNEAKEPNDFQRLTSQGLENLLKKSGFVDFEIMPFGERFSAAVHLLHSFFIFNFIRLIAFSKALILDKLIPKKIKKLHPCPLGYFIVARK